MADSKNDITTEVSASEEDLLELKKAQFQTNPNTRLARPSQVAENPAGLNPELMQMLKMGQRTHMFSGIKRCINVLDAGTPNAHHCMSMVVNNLSTNETVCTCCTQQQRAGDPRPRTINSSMIRLPKTDLEELGLTEDPLFGKSKPVEVVTEKPKRVKKVKMESETTPRRAKMPVPNKVTIEVTMEELRSDPNVVKTLLNKTLESIFELPVKNFREAEEIRVVKERVEAFLEEPKAEKERVD